MSRDLREIDRLVAEHVMGWTYRAVPWAHEVRDSVVDAERRVLMPPNAEPMTFSPGWYQLTVPIPPYSEDIAAAWEVVERFDWIWRLDRVGDGSFSFCLFTQEGVVGDPDHGDPDYFEGIADTAPLAICLAALKAKGVEIPDA